LIDLAAQGADSSGDLRSHLAACASCRSYVEQEQFLLASINTTVRAGVNAALPAALVQRLQARLAQESVPSHLWSPVLVTAATIAIVVLCSVVVQYRWHRAQTQAVGEPAQRGVATIAKGLPLSSDGERPGVLSAHQRRRTILTVPLRRASEVAHQDEPTVIVPPGQQLLLAEYARKLQNRTKQSRTLLARTRPGSEASLIEPIEMASNEIPELKLEPLPDLQSK